MSDNRKVGPARRQGKPGGRSRLLGGRREQAGPVQDRDTRAVVGVAGEGQRGLDDSGPARRQVPEYRADRRELLWRGEVVRRYRREAGNQLAVLRAFQERGWVGWIENPLGQEEDAQARLMQTVKDLNRELKSPSIAELPQLRRCLAVASDDSSCTLVDGYHHLILRVCRRHLRRDTQALVDADDMVQEVWSEFLGDRL
jgi:hypothetical protein